MNYCFKCGHELVETVSIQSYDSSDGRCRYLFVRKCPNRRWWQRGHAKASLASKSRAQVDAASEWEWYVD